MATTKQFLDYAGLSTLWGIINSTFATKTELDNVKKVAVGSFDEVATASDITITAKSVSGETVDTIVLGSASTTAAGLMSSADKSTLESLKETIDANTDFKCEDGINVFWISEYMKDEFVVSRWLQTVGGNE